MTVAVAVAVSAPSSRSGSRGISGVGIQSTNKQFTPPVKKEKVEQEMAAHQETDKPTNRQTDNAGVDVRALERDTQFTWFTWSTCPACRILPSLHAHLVF